MKVKDAIENIKDIEDLLNVLRFEDPEKGILLDHETISDIRRLLLKCKYLICELEVHSHADS